MDTILLYELATERLDGYDDVFYCEVLDAVGLETAAHLYTRGELTQDNAPRYDRQTLEPLRLWIESVRHVKTSKVLIPPPAKLDTDIVRFVGFWLSNLGLKQKQVGNHDDNTYALDIESLKRLFDRTLRESA
jgi:hypothetical protein